MTENDTSVEVLEFPMSVNDCEIKFANSTDWNIGSHNPDEDWAATFSLTPFIGNEITTDNTGYQEIFGNFALSPPSDIMV